jgi:hypothetical protein
MEILPQTVKAFDKLMRLEKIEHHHLQEFNADEKAAFMDKLYLQIARYAGLPLEQEGLVAKSIAILDNDFVWNYNHNKITTEIRVHYDMYGIMPGVAHLAAKCRLSRKTVARHVEEFNSNKEAPQAKGLKSMVDDTIMNVITKAACKGDLKAAKIYMDNKRADRQMDAKISTQNNYVHINNTVINQQVIQQLKPEQLKLIEQIIAGGGELGIGG